MSDMSDLFGEGDSDSHEDDTSPEESDDSDADRCCPKCGHEEARVGEVGMTSREDGYLRRDPINDLRYKRIECLGCGYTEFYREDLDSEQLADYFFQPK